jgi:5-oxoprolinase (ATP-hydrolysing)
LGRNAIQRAGGHFEELGSCVTTQLSAADVFIIETPGGGGYGR